MTRLIAIQGDITRLDVDVIVNAANRDLVPGGGVDGAIHRSGGPSIRAETSRIIDEAGQLQTGEAVITGAGMLPAHFVIHTPGPIWGETSPSEATALLAACYRNSLEVAANHDLASIAFPNISTGVYGFPVGLAATTAIGTVRKWVSVNPARLDQITFACFDLESFHLYQAGLAAG